MPDLQRDTSGPLDLLAEAACSPKVQAEASRPEQRLGAWGAGRRCTPLEASMHARSPPPPKRLRSPDENGAKRHKPVKKLTRPCEVCRVGIPSAMTVCQRCWFEKVEATARLGAFAKKLQTRKASDGENSPQGL